MTADKTADKTADASESRRLAQIPKAYEPATVNMVIILILMKSQ